MESFAYGFLSREIRFVLANNTIIMPPHVPAEAGTSNSDKSFDNSFHHWRAHAIAKKLYLIPATSVP